MNEEPRSVQESLRRLAEAAEELWRNYLANGPGSFAADAYDPIAAAIREIDEQVAGGQDTVPWAARWTTTREELALLQQAVGRPEGLCFVTGEAGLIPRRDLVERCELAVMGLAELAREVA